MTKRRRKLGNTPAHSRQEAGTLIEDYNKLADEFRKLRRENEKLRAAVSKSGESARLLYITCCELLENE